MPDRLCADCGEPGATMALGNEWFHEESYDCIAALRARLAEAERTRTEAQERASEEVARRREAERERDEARADCERAYDKVEKYKAALAAAQEREAGMREALREYVEAQDEYAAKCLTTADEFVASIGEWSPRYRDAMKRLRALAAGGHPTHPPNDPTHPKKPDNR